MVRSAAGGSRARRRSPRHGRSVNGSVEGRLRVTASTKAHNRIIAFAMALLLAFTALGPLPAASADEVSDAKAVLEDAQKKLDDIQAQCDELDDQVERLQAQIEETAGSAMALQEVLAEGRESLGHIANYEYRMSSMDTFLGIFLGSASFQEFIRNMDYLNLLAENQTAELQEQSARKDQFDSTMSLLSAQKDTQQTAVSQLEEKRAEAETVVEEAASKLQDAEAAEALRAQAAAIAKKEEQAASSSGGAPSGGSSGGSGGSSGGVPSGPSTGGAWQTTQATAYNPTGALTATGEPCTWNSMGVAMYMYMPGLSSYYGRKVEISYGQRSVVAVVNDCGGFAGHYPSTMFDLQPGVWKALGASSATEWGRRTIQYRFL